MSPSGDSCAHWMHYSEATKTREGWARSLLDEFKSNVEMLKSAVRDQQGPPPAHSSPQHSKQSHTFMYHKVSCVFICCASWCAHTAHHALWVFCPPVSLWDDVYGPLGSQERSGGEGVGLREAEGGLLEWSSHRQPPAQCCWCLEPGTMVCAHRWVR